MKSSFILTTKVVFGLNIDLNLAHTVLSPGLQVFFFYFTDLNLNWANYLAGYAILVRKFHPT